jgi:hypothetical protein
LASADPGDDVRARRLRDTWKAGEPGPLEIAAAYRRFLARPRSLFEISKPFTHGALGMLGGFVLMLVVGWERANEVPIVAEPLVLPAEPATRVKIPDVPTIPAPPELQPPAPVTPPRRPPRALVQKPAVVVRKSDRELDDAARWVSVGARTEPSLITGLGKQPKVLGPRD